MFSKKSNYIYTISLLIFTIGIAIGANFFILINSSKICRNIPNQNLVKEKHVVKKGIVFTGIITSHKFLNTRAKTVTETWARTMPGKVLFFTSFNSSTNLSLPLVKLPGIDDKYPPQKKSLSMLKYMYDYEINNYKWFIRADDDVYIKSEKLIRFLNSLDHRKPLFIGQASYQSNHNGNLSLEKGDNYCMGGPAMIFSRALLKRMGPFLNNCMKNMLSKHEDVEVSRCVQIYGGVQCTWSYEMMKLFNHLYHLTPRIVDNPLDTNVLNAITLHPFKNIDYLYKMKLFFDRFRITGLRHKRMKIENEILRKMNELVIKIKCDALKEIKNSISKRILSNSKHKNYKNLTFYNFHYLNQVVYMPKSWRVSFWEAYRQLSLFKNLFIDEFRLYSNKSSHFYERIIPSSGIDYSLVLEKIFKKQNTKIPSNLATVTVRQSFTEMLFIEDYITNSSNTMINFIVTLPSDTNVDLFKRFINNFEDVCLKNSENVSLKLVVKRNIKNLDKIHNYVDKVNKQYPNHIIVSQENDKISNECQAEEYVNDSIMVLLDISIIFNRDFLNRVRLNTIKNKHVYFPIVFNRYQTAPQYASIGERTGFWDNENFQVISIYKGDIRKVRKCTIDSLLSFNSKSKVNIMVHRSIDPGLISLYKSCDQLSDKEKMTCKAMRYGAQVELSHKVFSTLIELSQSTTTTTSRQNLSEIQRSNVVIKN